MTSTTESTGTFCCPSTGVLEAMTAGAYPLVPRRLAYPEVLDAGDPQNAGFFYDGSEAALAERLAGLAERQRRGDLWQGDPGRGRRFAARYHWDRLVPVMDDALESVPGSRP